MERIAVTVAEAAEMLGMCPKSVYQLTKRADFPAFKAAATRGDAWSFMGGYNLFRGEHASSNPYLMNEVLKGE